MKRKRTTPVPPQSTSGPVRFEEVEYLRLRVLLRDADMTAAAAATAVQKDRAACAAYLAVLGKKYGFDPTAITTMQWNDETFEFRFAP